MAPGSIEEVAARLALWCRKPGAGMAIVEFSSEFSRREVLERLRAQLGSEVHELRFSKTGDVEHDVRDLVRRLRQAPFDLVSIAGLEAAFEPGEVRQKAVTLLNFLRETIASFHGRQIWWTSPDATQLLRKLAQDSFSWFRPVLELTESKVVPVQGLINLDNDWVNLDSARARIAGAMERIAKGHESRQATWELWADAAFPALSDLARAGVPTREYGPWFLNLIYGNRADRNRAIHDDLATLARQGAAGAAAALARALEERVLAREPQEMLAPAGKLARLYASQGRFEEAEALVQSALHDTESTLGVDHPQAAALMNDLALLYTRQGRSQEAEPLLALALRTNERALGAGHPNTLISIANLASLYESRNRYPEAAALYARAVEGLTQAFGPADARTLDAQAALARVQALTDPL